MQDIINRRHGFLHSCKPISESFHREFKLRSCRRQALVYSWFHTEILTYPIVDPSRCLDPAILTVTGDMRCTDAHQGEQLPVDSRFLPPYIQHHMRLRVSLDKLQQGMLINDLATRGVVQNCIRS